MYLVGALYVLYLSVWFYVFIGNKTLYPVLASVAPGVRCGGIIPGVGGNQHSGPG